MLIAVAGNSASTVGGVLWCTGHAKRAEPLGSTLLEPRCLRSLKRIDHKDLLLIGEGLLAARLKCRLYTNL